MISEPYFNHKYNLQPLLRKSLACVVEMDTKSKNNPEKRQRFTTNHICKIDR